MSQHTFLCVSCYFKGEDFLIACKEAGNRVLLVTSRRLEHSPWPRSHIDEIYFMQEDEEGQWNNNDLINGLAYVMRSTRIDRLIALDDFDVERVAMLREHFRMPGMGQSTARHFRDKLAMRMKACEGGVLVPPFTSLFHDADIHAFTDSTPAPWVLKPRGEASATGIVKLHSADELWHHLSVKADTRHHFLLEQFVPGQVFHVDALSYSGACVFARASAYVDTPFEVAHGGGIFRTLSIPEDAQLHSDLIALNQQLMTVFGMRHGASHSEYIKSAADGRFYFLETSSRVGGAHIAEMVEAASGVNLWREWARLETALLRGEDYVLPQVEHSLAGTIISLSRYRDPDYSSFQDQEIWWRMSKENHIGFILKGKDHQRLTELLNHYSWRIQTEFHAALAAPKRSSH